SLEERTLMATLPTPVVSNPDFLRTTSGTAQKGINPQIVIDPINPSKMVTVAGNGTSTTLLYSLDGGDNWTSFGPLRNLPDPNIAPTTTTAGSASTVSFNQSVASAAIDRLENLYVVIDEFSANFDSGELVLYKYDFTASAAPTLINLHPAQT